MENITTSELTAQAARLYAEAKSALLDGSAESMTKAEGMIAEAKALQKRAAMLSDLEGMATEAKATAPQAKAESKPGFDSLGDFLNGVYQTKRRGVPDPRVTSRRVRFTDEPTLGTKSGWEGAMERKDLVENIGADGGFLVPQQYVEQLFMLSAFGKYVRERALVIPMRGRQIIIPTLDQTGTSTDRSNLYGGVKLTWTEEATEKTETQPAFRQATLIAHKLAAVTQVSDELLADSFMSIETLLARLFSEATMNEHDWAFIQGTGAGMPLGIANVGSGATIAVPRAVANAISIADVFNMLTNFTGQSPIWLAHQSTMPEILGLAGPAANPSYVWIDNAREGVPMTLFGYPIYFTENCPTLGQRGDLILADWSKYVIGLRQDVTVDASMHYAFVDDVTTWRAVSRIDGRPWLSAPLTLRDGTTEVSPFVVLDGVGAS